MKRNLLVILFIGLLIGCNEESGENYRSSRPKTERELKRELHTNECSRASRHLSGNLKYTARYKGLLSMKVNGLKLNCTIENNATLATFKDIKARVKFISKTGAVILTRTFNIYEFIEPNGSINYRTEIDITNQQYKDIDTYSWTIISANCK